MKQKLIGVHGGIMSGKSVVCEALPIALKVINGRCKVGYASLSTRMKLATEKLTGVDTDEVLHWIPRNYNFYDNNRDYSHKVKNQYIQEMDATVGQVLQWMGAGVKQFNSHVWIEQVKTWAKHKQFDYLVIDGVRYVDDVLGILEEGGMNIKVCRVGDESSSDSRDLSHQTEIGLDGYEGFNWVYHNETQPNRGLAVMAAVDAIIANKELFI